MAQILSFNCATESEVMIMSQRTGRPKSESPKTIEVKLELMKKPTKGLTYIVKNTMSQGLML